MDVLLISFAICVLGVMVTVLLFAVAMRPASNEEQAHPGLGPEAEKGGFFLEESAGSPAIAQDPTNALLLNLEHHVRKEQEAARAFLDGPNPDSLHAPSYSPLWH